MKEGLLRRIGRVISGSTHAMVDALENSAPQVTMEQAIREVDEAISDVKSQLSVVEANRYMAVKTLNKENERHNELQSQMEIALQTSRDDLAEIAIAQQLDIEAQLPILEKNVLEYDEEITNIQSCLEALSAKKREMRDQLKLYIESQKQAELTTGADKGHKASIDARVAQAEDAFERMSNSELSHINTKDQAQLSELKELARKHRIQERLLAAKKSNTL